MSCGARAVRRLVPRLGRLLAGARTVGRLLASATATGLHDVTRITKCDVLYASQSAAPHRRVIASISTTLASRVFIESIFAIKAIQEGGQACFVRGTPNPRLSKSQAAGEES